MLIQLSPNAGVSSLGPRGPLFCVFYSFFCSNTWFESMGRHLQNMKKGFNHSIRCVGAGNTPDLTIKPRHVDFSHLLVIKTKQNAVTCYSDPNKKLQSINSGSYFPDENSFSFSLVVSLQYFQNVISISMFFMQKLPINIKFCFEGMEESGSEGLDDLVFSRKDSFFKDVDYVCISDNYWLGKTKPCITYGLRGICYFFIEVKS